MKLPPIAHLEVMPWEGDVQSDLTLWTEDAAEIWPISTVLQGFQADAHSKPRDPTESPTRCLLDYIGSMGRIFRRPRPPHEVEQDRALERERVQMGGPQYQFAPESERSCDWATWEALQRAAYKIVRGEPRPW